MVQGALAARLLAFARFTTQPGGSGATEGGSSVSNVDMPSARRRHGKWSSLASNALLSLGSGLAIAITSVFPLALTTIRVQAAAIPDVGGAGVFELDGN